MAKTFPLEVITPERKVFSGEVEMLVVPGINGNLGILPKHTPLISRLTQGELKIKSQEGKYSISIGGGFIKVAKDKSVVLVTRAVKEDELIESEILTAIENAKKG